MYQDDKRVNKRAGLHSVRPIPSEDRRPIEDLTSKPRPNSEPAFFSFFGANWAPSARDSFNSFALRQGPSACTSHGDDEVYLFPSMSRRAILGTLPACARPLSHARLSLSRHATCHGGQLSTDLGIEGAPAVPHSLRVGSRSTGCSNSHRFSS